jgi:thiamine kinase-like enzyme
LKHIKKYQKTISQKSTIDNKLKKSLEKFYPHLENFQNKNWSPVLCHHDLNPANIIKTDKGMKIIDWEFAGYGHPKYDLYCIGLKDEDDFFFSELINLINDLWVMIDND